MRMIESVLELGSNATPACRCSAEMQLARFESRPNGTGMKVFLCPRCAHEMHLMVWSDDQIAA